MYASQLANYITDQGNGNKTEEIQFQNSLTGSHYLLQASVTVVAAQDALGSPL